MSWQADQPYNQLPLLPPDLDNIETITVLKACISARAALAELKQAGALIPNQSMLVNLLPLLEAKDSSEIENIVTTTDKLFQYSQEEYGADHATKEALRYRTALYQGFVELKNRPLCSSTAIDVCSTLKNIDMGIFRVPGTVIGNQTTSEIIYTPPSGETVIQDLLTLPILYLSRFIVQNKQDYYRLLNEVGSDKN